MLVISLILFKLSKTSWKQIGSVFKVIMVFMLINVLAIFIFAPYQGAQIYGTEHILYDFGGRWVITQEQLFYELNVVIKTFFCNLCRQFLCLSLRQIHQNLQHL